jgi:hypothetical protein
MRLVFLSLAGAALLTACSPAAEDAATEPAPAETPAATPPAATPPATTPPAAPADDACGAAEKQAWVGQPRSSVPAAPAGQTWRVYETGDAVTQDFRPDRLNVEVDPATQNVVRVSCG